MFDYSAYMTMKEIARTNEGGAKRHLHLFGFYALSKTFIAITQNIFCNMSLKQFTTIHN
jgi:hypothetical protein